MNLELSDEEAAALTKELAEIARNDRYPFSERARTLRAILAKGRHIGPVGRTRTSGHFPIN
jgi:hypothetical protein